MLVEKISEFCLRYKLPKNKLVAVAVSGGVDSMALVVALQMYGQNIVALIVDHGIRKNSSEDALCTQKALVLRGIKTHILTWEHAKIASNIENIARANRYRLLFEQSKIIGCEHLFLGHHADDQVETFLINLLRGSGIDGLCAMSEVTTKERILVMRPFLLIKKANLCAFLIQNGTPWLEDETNADLSIVRNKIRFLLQEMSPDLYEQRILLAIGHMQQAKQILDAHNKEIYNRIVEAGPSISYESYIELLPMERLYILNTILMKLSNRQYKMRLSKVKNLDDRIVGGVCKASLAGCSIALCEGKIVFTKG